VVKIILIILIVVFGFFAVSIASLMTNHQIKLNKESKLYEPIGEIVLINEKKMHLYTEGQGELTFVFLSGHGTSSPTLDFKPLWSKLSEQHKIVVVEKFGYGFSDISNEDKDLDTILEQTRSALSLLNIEGPYVIVPHSLSGLEAIYWAQKYPLEVKAIIGLDPCTADVIALLPKVSKAQLNLVYFITRIGLSRLMPQSNLKQILPLLHSPIFSDNENSIYQYMFYRSSLTVDMLNELKASKQNAALLNQHELPISTPTYFFISEEQDTLIPGWKEALTGYLELVTNQKHMMLETSHYIHHDMSSLIYDEMMMFLNELE
jgi:pimeloyl-ACP methyl ester carboxylesterase